MMIYNQTSLVAKGSTYQKNCRIYQILIIRDLAVTMTLKIYKSIFLRDILAHDGASLYQVWLQNVWCFRSYHLDKHSLTCWTFHVTSTLYITIQFPHKTLQLMMMYQQTKDQQFRRYNRNSHILIIWIITMTFTLKLAHKSFCMTLCLMMIHHHGKFGHKKVQWFRRYRLDKHSCTFWTFSMTLTLNTAIQIFSQDTLANGDVPSNQVWLQRDQPFWNYSRNSQILIK